MTERIGFILANANGRFHPLVWRRAPMPGMADEKMAAKRYKTAGHHTKGFNTLELARAYFKENGIFDTGDIADWDGIESPVAVAFFDIEKCKRNLAEHGMTT